MSYLKESDPYTDLFDPSVVTQKFCKKVSKKDSSCRQGYIRDIDNSLWGLHDYLTAANIRNKSKHLLFLAMRFTKCLEIYIDNKFNELTVRLQAQNSKIVGAPEARINTPPHLTKSRP